MAKDLPDLTEFLKKYEALASESDAVFEHIRSQFPNEVICKAGCCSCCYALFDLSLVEALYIKDKFDKTSIENLERFNILDNASTIDRQIAKIKRQAFKDSQSGKDSNEILEEMALQKIRCPLLDKDDNCILYEHRPITCRLYGVPTAIGGKGHTCRHSGFEAGKKYPTVALEKIQERLTLLSKELADYIDTSYSELHFMYVPVSTALITTYDAKYLGIGGISREEE